ncbi:unnamed protein product [Spirodela intermedia]|uniref:Uncharacterized protein n=2 Tax=Spirodela intermedia TaxID=51605 RepID=A0A7I8K824_SPIIN|nr:unnamed protein product [Spirodela intermedia]CAA6657742.1 unnamed protein product [Spirodela intermedia]CAA7393854.1 unnamed protein product [Spirodela intermedia]
MSSSLSAEEIPLLKSDAGELQSKLPLKAIPGSYGIPFISPVMDRLDFLYNQGGDQFFQSRIDRYGSTVLRVNAPPGPFMARNSKVVAVVDAKSFQVLFDCSKVEKKDVFTGTYVPSTSFTGGYRVCAYLDPSEPTHTKVKQVLLHLLAARKTHVIPEFRASYSGLFSTMEEEIARSGKFVFNDLNDDAAFEFLGKVFTGVSPSATALGSSGPNKATKWLFLQLCPIMTLGLPKILEDLLLHTFPLPFFVAKKDYAALYDYFSSAAQTALDFAEELGLSREEACHNLVFAACFNAFGGLKVLLPGVLQFLAKSGSDLHARLADEVRSAVRSEGGELTAAALEKMELTKSVVYEALRMDPPVKYQYGVAKRDLVVESHEASYAVKAGEILFGYQPLATRDPQVFGPDAGEFVADRFVGERGRELLRYVVWSNGPETENPTAGDKQCPGKDISVLTARLLVAEFFLRYDTFAAELGQVPLAVKVTFTSLTKATAGSKE